MKIVSFYPSHQFTDRVKTLFEEQRQKLSTLFPNAQIEHIGSTAIPGLLTKGDLDINLRVQEDEFSQTVDLLKNLYEINQPHNWTKSFASFKDEANFDLDVGIQLTLIGGPEDKFLAFRDALLANPDLINEYNDLKSKWNGKPMEEYREEKEKFCEKVLAEDVG